MKKFVLTMMAVLALVMTANAKNGNTEGLATPVKENAVQATQAVATYSLKGVIYDAEAKETVAGATITINGKKYYSDLSGNFSIPHLPRGKYNATVDFVSYQSQTVEIDMKSNNEVRVEMKQQ